MECIDSERKYEHTHEGEKCSLKPVNREIWEKDLEKGEKDGNWNKVDVSF